VPPYICRDSYYEHDVADAAPALRQEDTGPGGGFARLEDAGFRLDHIREELATRMPVGPEQVLLELPEGTPVIELIRTTYDTTRRPVEVMRSVIAGDMASFCYDFPIPD
jgi:GntR family transcriptional regulator